jgi:flagellar protein FlaI
MENRATAIVVGATAAGKTTFMNALLSMIRSSAKVVTIEEVQEVNFYHPNWAPLVARPTYGVSDEAIGEVGLFDLVRAAMRMRPDVLVVGEVRGSEAYALFQAISTGHGGLCTLHAEDVTSAIQRLTSKPMDVAPSYISFLDLVFSVRRVAISNPGGGPPKLARRVISVDEVLEFNKYLQVFRWDASTDKYQTPGLEQSAKLRKLARDQGKGFSDITQEMNDRMQVLQWMKVKNMRNYVEIAGIFSQYHQDRESILRRARADFQYAPASSPFAS